MSTIDHVKTTLDTLRAGLKTEKEGIVALLKDSRVADWQSIDLRRHHDLLACLDIDSAAIAQALVDYPRKTKAIGKQLAGWANEIGNQQADLLDKPDPDTAQARANALVEKCRRLTAMKEDLQATIRCLLTADQTLRRQLNLHAVLGIVKTLAIGKKDLYPEGLAILFLLVPEAGKAEGQSLHELRQEAARLETRFPHLDITRLPRLVEEVLFHHIEAALAASREIGLYLQTVDERMSREVETIATLEKDLAALQAEPLAHLIDGLLQQAVLVGNLLSALYHKRQLKETLTAVGEGLECLSILHLLLKNRIIPALQQEVTAEGSALNPITIAAKMTHGFFGGPQGMIRSFKLMLNSLTGKAAVNEIELQLILEKGVMNCKTFYGKSRDDLKKMKYYIDSLVGHYQRPFPYNELCKLSRETLAIYGDGVDKFIAGYPVPKEMQRAPHVPAKVGKLLAAIAQHRDMFQKANADSV